MKIKCAELRNTTPIMETHVIRIMCDDGEYTLTELRNGGLWLATINGSLVIKPRASNSVHIHEASE